MRGHLTKCKRAECDNKYITRKDCMHYCSYDCRFLDKVVIGNQQDCWIYKGAIDISGYGKFSVGYKEIKAHRYMWVLKNGPIPDGKLILHHCDNPPCCNPSHLYAGTPKDNVRDMFMRDRNPYQRGAKNPFAKLTEDQVKSIKVLVKSRLTLSAIATKYGVGIGTIFDIKHGRTWTHI